MAKQVLTEKTLKKLAKRPAKSGKRYDTMDAVPGFGVRVTDKGHLIYIPAGRSPGSKSYTRREIGEVGACTLSAAREKARAWIEWIKAGKDPSAEMERAKREQARKQAHTFESVAQAFISEWVVSPDAERPRQRRASQAPIHFIVIGKIGCWRERNYRSGFGFQSRASFCASAI